MDIEKLTPIELANLSKMTGEDLALIKLHKIWATAATIVIGISLMGWTTCNVSDRLGPQQAVKTTQTTETVAYPGK